MAGFHTLIIGWQCEWRLQPQQAATFNFGIAEMPKKHIRIGMFKIPAGKFNLGAFENIAVSFAAFGSWHTIPIKVIDIFNALNIHRQPFQPVGKFKRHRITFNPANLLEIGELRNFHAITPDFPAKTPCAKRW